MNRIIDKIKEIEKFLDELDKIMPKKLENYKNDNFVKAACERYFEKIVESVNDLAFIIISLKKLEMPQDDVDAFRILAENKIITENLCKKLKQAKGMRNVIAHQYGSVDDEIVFNSLAEELEDDVNKFLNAVKKV